MTLSDIAIRILSQLTDLIQQIQESDFSKPSATLSGSTIGQHVRHTLEFFLCFEAGYREGVVNYDRRARDTRIETDQQLALNTIRQIIAVLPHLEEHRPLVLKMAYDPMESECVSVSTNCLRELVYNIEHAVHHMAIIKIAVREMASYVSLDEDFGIAASTIRHRTVAGNISES